MVDPHYRLANMRDELLLALTDLVEYHQHELMLNEFETLFERLAYLYEVAGGERSVLIERFSEVYS